MSINMTQVVDWKSEPVYYVDASTGRRYCKRYAQLLDGGVKQFALPINHQSLRHHDEPNEEPIAPRARNSRLQFLWLE